MLVVVVEPDRSRSAAITRELRTRGCRAICASDFDSAERMLTSRARPAALYVADLVPPLAGADLLALVERNERLAGVPVLAHVADEDSLLAATLKRGGIRVVGGGTAPAVVAAQLAARALASDAADWRDGVLAWSRYLQWRCNRNRQLTAQARARSAEQLSRALKATMRAEAAQRGIRRRKRNSPPPVSSAR